MKAFFGAIAASLLASALAQPFNGLPLSPYVKADLAKRDPSTYQVFDTRSHTGSHKTVKNVARGAPNGLEGVQEACKTDKCLAYTFDDGPYTDHKQVIDTAVANNISITYFVNVNNYECIYSDLNVDRLKYSFAKGAEICSHTATHPHLNTLTHAQIDRELQLVEDALYKILGIVPNCLRPPYGELSEENAKYIQDKFGYAILNWNLDTRDSLGASVDESLENLKQNVTYPMKTTILSHETIHTSVYDLFPQAIKLLKGKGYQSQDFMTVSKAFGFKPYKVVGKPGTRDETWTCDGIDPNPK